MLVSSLAASLVNAQAPLPEEIFTASKLSGDQTSRMQQFAADVSKDLESADPALVNKARRALIRPLESARTSVDFRLQYGESLVPALSRSAQNARDLNAVNALVVAGAIGTDQASRVLEDALKSDRVPVRFAAVNGLGRMLEQAARSSPAFTSDRAATILRLVREHAETETEPEILAAALRGLEAGLQIPSGGQLGRIRDRAAEHLGTVGAARIKALEVKGSVADALKPFARSAEALRSALINPDPRQALPEQAKTAGEAFGAEALQTSLRLLKLPQLKPGGEQPAEAVAAERAALADFVRLAQSIHEAANAWTGAAVTPGDAIVKGDDAAATVQIEAILKR